MTLGPEKDSICAWQQQEQHIPWNAIFPFHNLCRKLEEISDDSYSLKDSFFITWPITTWAMLKVGGFKTVETAEFRFSVHWSDQRGWVAEDQFPLQICIKCINVCVVLIVSRFPPALKISNMKWNQRLTFPMSLVATRYLPDFSFSSTTIDLYFILPKYFYTYNLWMEHIVPQENVIFHELDRATPPDTGDIEQ